MYMCMCIYVYMYIHTHIYVYIYIYSGWSDGRRQQVRDELYCSYEIIDLEIDRWEPSWRCSAWRQA